MKKNKIIRNVFFLLTLFLFFGCSTKNPINNRFDSPINSLFISSSYDNLNNVIKEIANQLLLNITTNNQINNKIAFTSFVELDNFNKTNSFGRMLSESLINELHERRFKVIDYRTKKFLLVDNNGEFVLSRNTNELKEETSANYFLVGTYTKLDSQNIVINSRILNLNSNDVISTSRVIFNCQNSRLCLKSLDNQQSKTILIMEK